MNQGSVIMRLQRKICQRICSVILLLFCGAGTQAQNKEVLTADVFIDQVKLYHPVVKQANLQVDRAKASLMAARGSFDPVGAWNHDEKVFNGLNYYRYSNPELKLPTTTGISVKSGFENTGGLYANPELTSGVASYIGLEIPLLKGLLIDKQRAALRQAKLFNQQSRQEQAAAINGLLEEAFQAYWEWVGAHLSYNLFTKYLQVAEERMNLTRIAFINGDRSMGDTIEAYSQLQNFIIQQNDAAVSLNARYYDLSLYLWNEKGQPYLLADNYLPDSIMLFNRNILPRLDSLENQLLTGHPYLSAFRFKLRMLDVERQLKSQNRLPWVQLNANLLSKEYFETMRWTYSNLSNNYKLGITVKAPLFNRQARGEFREVKLKIKESQWQYDQKSWELQNKLRKYYAEALLYDNQIKNADAIKGNYNDLLRLEEMKFMQGESSLFLVNARENKLLEIDQKLLSLQVKYKKAYYSLLGSAGVLR